MGAETEILHLIHFFREFQRNAQAGETLKLRRDLVFKNRLDSAVGERFETLVELQFLLNDARGPDDGVEFHSVVFDTELVGDDFHLIQTFFQPLPEHTRLAAPADAGASPVGTVLKIGLEPDAVVIRRCAPEVERKVRRR